MVSAVFASPVPTLPPIPVERRHVAARKVHHVDVVAHAGAVVRGIVVAEHADAFQLAYGHLRNVGQQVVGDALGILADQALSCAPMGLK